MAFNTQQYLPRRRQIVAFCLLVAVVTLAPRRAAVAADEPAAPPAQSEKPIYAEQPQCRSWTDECVNCTRGENGATPLCSNIGTSCQPKAIRCVEPEPAKPPPADETKTPR